MSEFKECLAGVLDVLEKVKRVLSVMSVGVGRVVGPIFQRKTPDSQLVVFSAKSRIMRLVGV